MDIKEMIAPLEAVLFTNGDPITEHQLMEVFDIEDTSVVAELIDSYQQELANRNSGLTLQHVAGGWQLVTKAELYEYIRKLSEARDKKLSPACMETLSIVAFKQPITKQEIEKIRGVHVDRMIAKLLELELICELGRKQIIGRPILYGTTEIFLKSFGLNDIRELPALPEADMSQLEPEQLAMLGENGTSS